MIAAKPEREASLPRPQTVPTYEDELQHARRELVRRIVLSPSFARTERLSTLLTYVCDMALKGRETELNEQRIGQAVFGRTQDYDSNVDGIVRSQASRLRQRLDLYFQQEGADEPIRVVIPRGAYVPFFETRPLDTANSTVEVPVRALGAEAATQAETAIMVEPVPTNGTTLPIAGWLPWTLCMALASMLVGLWLHDRHTLRWAEVTLPQTHALWSHIFTRNEATLVVTADSGLVMFHNMSEVYLGLNDYMDGKYRSELSGPGRFGPAKDSKDWIVNLAGRRYTSMVDLDTVLSLKERARTLGSDVYVRYARDLRPNDLKTGNVILLGASEADPWVELFERNMNFVFQNDYRKNVFSVFNRHPQGREPAQWNSSWNDPQRRVYGLVAYMPNLAGDGNALILEGTSMSGTESARDFVANDAQLLPFLKQIQKADGTLPHFEVLLENQNMGASAVQSKIIAWRSIY